MLNMPLDVEKPASFHVPKYISGAAPANLKTKGQLKALWLKPGPIRGVVGFYEIHLFDVAEAIPYSPEEIAAEKERQRAARHRHCPHCDRDVPKHRFDSEWKSCDKCLGEVIRCQQECLRAEYEKMLRLIGITLFSGRVAGFLTRLRSLFWTGYRENWLGPFSRDSTDLANYYRMRVSISRC